MNDSKSVSTMKKADDSDDDWSDNDSAHSSNSAPLKKPPALLTAGARHPSGVIVKQTVSGNLINR